MRVPTDWFSSRFSSARGKILTCDQLAERLHVSKRTVYRDIQDLSQPRGPAGAIWQEYSRDGWELR